MVAIIGVFIFLVVLAFGRKGKENQRRRRAAHVEKRKRLRAQGVELATSSTKTKSMVLFVVLFSILAIAVSAATFNFYSSASVVITILVAGVFGLILALLSAMVADTAELSGRSWLSFFWLSLLISPLVTWLVVAALGSQLSSGHDTALSTSSGSLSAEIERLSALYEEGGLTAEEFAAAKKKLLGE
jgi:hypothetical protein